MNILRHRGGSIDRRQLEQAVEALRAGDIILYPTDTLYALGCDATNNKAVARLCDIKGINPAKNVLSVVCADIRQAAAYASIDNRAFAILKDCLPGPYTFILPAAGKLSKAFKGRRQVGVRIPGCDIATSLAQELGNPIMSTSVPLTDDDMENGEIDGDDIASRYTATPGVEAAFVADPCLTVPYTVVDLSDSANPVLVRQGKGQFGPL